LLIGIIMNRITWEIRQILNELEKRNIKYKLLNNSNIFYKLTKDKDLEDDFDIILERSLSYFRGLFSCAILESKGYKVINNFNCLNLSGNKLLTTLELIKRDIPTPNTCISFKQEAALKIIEEIIKYPAILKPVIGSWGRLIARLDDYNSAMANLECREEMGNTLQKIFYIQKYINKSDPNYPTDIRIIVIGDKCAAAMGRYHPKTDFRSNIAIGGTAKTLEMTKDLQTLSIKASKAINGEFVGVDLMEDNGELNVIEVNGTPQFQGITNATNINIASELVDYIISKYG